MIKHLVLSKSGQEIVSFDGGAWERQMWVKWGVRWNLDWIITQTHYHALGLQLLYGGAKKSTKNITCVSESVSVWASANSSWLTEGAEDLSWSSLNAILPPRGLRQQLLLVHNKCLCGRCRYQSVTVTTTSLSHVNKIIVYKQGFSEALLDVLNYDLMTCKHQVNMPWVNILSTYPLT